MVTASVMKGLRSKILIPKFLKFMYKNQYLEVLMKLTGFEKFSWLIKANCCLRCDHFLLSAFNNLTSALG